MKSSIFAIAAALASSAHAVQNATYCTDSNSICYTVNVPASTAANSGTGDLYFQISGPATMRWIGFGQGSQMAGSNMFVIYSNAAGDNLTLSPRHGLGEVMPLQDTTTNVTLLAGSGISNGQMVANVLCSSCNSWTGGSTMNFDNPKASFIWAYLIGQPLASDSLSASIAQHNQMGSTTLDLATAAGGSTSNPFLSTSTDSSNGTSTSTSSANHGGSPGLGGTSSFGGGSFEVGSTRWFSILKAHGIIGGLTFAVLFPLGAILVRLFSFRGLVYAHAAWQIMALILALVTLGLGVWLADSLNYLSQSHAIIGIVAIAAVCIQPFTGLLHHILFKRTGGRNVATLPHVWWGRAAVTLGIINGGLGLRLAKNTYLGYSRSGTIAYSVVAWIMWVLWMLVILVTIGKNRDRRNGGAVGGRDFGRDGRKTRISSSIFGGAGRWRQREREMSVGGRGTGKSGGCGW